MITDKEAKNLAAKIRRGKDSHADRVAYERWSKVDKGRRKRTSLAELMADRRKREAAEDLLKVRVPPKRVAPEPAPRYDDVYFEGMNAVDGPGVDGPSVTPPEPPIAPPLPLEGEIVEPIAPPIDLPETAIPGFDIGNGVVKGARTFFEKQDARNGTEEVGGISLTSILGVDFWNQWEAALERMRVKYGVKLDVGDDELVVGGAAVVVAQPIVIPVIKERGPAWLAMIKSKLGFGS